ncbi:hypothetical protein GLOIN_2v1543475, partial [Rhizophagus irregularis DAOM 181602=DAOM 197198]
KKRTLTIGQCNSNKFYSRKILLNHKKFIKCKLKIRIKVIKYLNIHIWWWTLISDWVMQLLVSWSLKPDTNIWFTLISCYHTTCIKCYKPIWIMYPA